MNDIAQEHAVASQMAYIFEEKGYDVAEQELKQIYPNYTIDKELSDNYSITLVKPDGSSILAYRGTARADDIMADIVIASGLYKADAIQYIQLPNGAYEYLPAGFTRFNVAQRKYEEVSAKYDKTTLAGHSLGGSLAHRIGKINNVESHIFNPGSTPNFPHEYYSDSNTYLVKGDIISMFASTFTDIDKIKYIDQTADYAHSLQNFLIKSNLPSKITIQDATFTDKEIIKQICKEFPELCPTGE